MRHDPGAIRKPYPDAAGFRAHVVPTTWLIIDVIEQDRRRISIIDTRRRVEVRNIRRTGTRTFADAQTTPIPVRLRLRDWYTVRRLTAEVTGSAVPHGAMSVHDQKEANRGVQKQTEEGKEKAKKGRAKNVAEHTSPTVRWRSRVQRARDLSRVRASTCRSRCWFAP